MAVPGTARLSLFGIALVVALASLAAARQPMPTSQPVVAASPDLLRQAVTDMGSEDVILRMDAQSRLADGASYRLRDIEAMIKEGKLEPEQRMRLQIVAYKRFCREPRAALGVQSSFSDVTNRGVLLSMIMPGFPAGETLRAGDRILNVDGQAITDISIMRPVVIAHDPGDEVPVVLVRDGAVVNLKVKLGRYNDLSRDPRGGSQALTPDMLQEAWEFRVATYDKGTPPGDVKPIESGIAIADWDSNDAVETDDSLDATDPRRWGNARRRLDDVDSKDVELVAAGEARGGGAVIVQRSGTPMAGGNARLAPADGQVPFGPRAADAAGVNRQIELARIRQSQESLRGMMRRNSERMATVNNAMRQALRQQNELIQQKIDELELLAVQPAPPAKPVKP